MSVLFFSFNFKSSSSVGNSYESQAAKKSLPELVAMRDTHSCLLGHFGRLALEWGQSEQSRRKATALGVLATVSAGYVSGGAHSPWYKVCLSSHERTVTGEDLLFSSFFPRHPNFSLPRDWWLGSMAEPVGKLKGCWLTSRIHSATILCIAHGLPALRLF